MEDFFLVNFKVQVLKKEAKMPKKISIKVFLTVVVAMVALFAAPKVMAQDSCNPLGNIIIKWEGVSQLPNGNWLATYSFEGKVSEITSVDLALDKDVNVIVSEGLHYSEPCEGGLGDLKWGEGMCEQRILTGTPQLDPQGNFTFQFEVTTGAEGKGAVNVNATKGRNGVCSITVPIETLPSYVSVPSQKCVEIGGVEYCVDIDPNTGCPDPETAFFYCKDDPDKTPIPVDDTFQIVSDGITHGLVNNQGTTGDPRCPIGLIVGGSPGCGWITLFGNAYRVCW